MWDTKLYEIVDADIDYKYYHHFHGNNIYKDVFHFEFKNGTMFVKTTKVLKTTPKNTIKTDPEDFDKLSKLIDNEYKYFKLMYGFKFPNKN